MDTVSALLFLISFYLVIAVAQNDGLISYGFNGGCPLLIQGAWLFAFAPSLVAVISNLINLYVDLADIPCKDPSAFNIK